MRRLSLACFVLTLLSLGSVYAQSGSTTGSIVGTVKDSQGALLAGAALTIRQIETNLTRKIESGEDGSYLLAQLPPGNYEVTAEVDGFETKMIKIELAIGTTALTNFTLPVSGASEIIEVKAESVINEGKTESSTNIDRERISGLPINRRNFLDFSLTAARVTRNRTPGEGVTATSGLSFNGQSARGNNITIDGLDNNDLGSGSVRSTFSQDAVQEFQIVSDGYSAEFGRALGGIVNIVTKGGTNELHGTAFFLIRNDRISARDVFSPTEPPYEQYQFGATVGGPIKKDRAFFFSSFERLSIKQNNIVTIGDDFVAAARRQGFTLSNGPIPFSLGTTSLLGRVDAQLSPNNRLWIRYNYGGNYNGSFEPFGGLTGETAGGIQRLDDSSVALNNVYTNAGLNLSNETRFLYSRRTQIVLPFDDGPQVRIDTQAGRIIFGRNQLLPQPRFENIYQFVNNVTLIRGDQQIKFGIDFSYVDESGRIPIFPGGVASFVPLDFSALSGIPGLPFFTPLESLDPTLRTSEQRAFLTLLSSTLPDLFPGFPSGLPLADLALPITYTQGFGSPEIDLPVKTFSGFIQDDIKLRPNLLLKAGLRYDINRIRFMPDNRGNMSPRLALAYRPQRLPELAVRASYGIFFAAPFSGPAFIVKSTSLGTLKLPLLMFPFSILPFSLQGHRFPESDSLPPGVDFIPQLSQTFQFQPDLRNSYSHQASAGLDYLIGSNTTLSLNYQFVRGIKILSQREINPIVRPIPGNQTQSSITGRIDPTRGSVREFESAFDSYYHGLTITLERRLAGRFNFLAHYTFSKAIDNFQDFRSESRSDPLRPGDDRGLSLQDVRSRFGFSGVFDFGSDKNLLLRDLQLSAILSLESGRPFNLDAGIDIDLDGDTNDRPLGLGRNVGITPGFASLDLRLQRKISIREGFRIESFVEVFNLFNRVNIDPNASRNESFPPDARGNFNLPEQEDGRFILPRERYRRAFAPRQFQIGFRFTF
jgi:hypothetical protein